MQEINSSKDLFEYIRKNETNNVQPLKSMLALYNIQKLSVTRLIQSLRYGLDKILLIDARSEKEFEESSLPYSLNFPILNNFERHNVGLIYKKYSQTSALWLAMQYADPKIESLKEFLEANKAADKNIYVYCWRGGGRSGYLAKMISDIGYNVTTITGGQRAFRKSVNEFFSINKFPYELIELSGLTGCGKTELLESVSDELPVINLELAARHFSSLLGHIPYQIKNFRPVKNQSAFENNIYSQIRLSDLTDSSDLLDLNDSTHSTHFLIESESRKVGDFEIPKKLFDKLQTAPAINIISTFENRIKRIVRDYFGDDLRGILPVKSILTGKEKFFKQQLSNKIFNELIFLLDSERVYDFTEIMIKEYYDKKYKDKGKKPIGEISSDNIDSAKKELHFIYKNYLS